MFLDDINGPQDVKKLQNGDLKKLSEEVREFLIENISRTGGHLASNLGVVELTIALLKIFDFPKDKIIWDVGHQSYVYKMLTGRKDRFDGLRQLDGMSGFPKTSESEFDFFNTGHSSTSISAALGMARARDYMEQNFNVIAVIGDGAMTGGMAFEALNDAAHSKNKLIIVLNDNEMSISKNVGGLARYLSNIRISPSYMHASEGVKKFLSPVPWLKRGVTWMVDGIKNLVKLVILPGRFFQQLGIKYIGPVDGHSFRELQRALLKASLEKGPVIVHMITTKGKGYEHAENNPDEFHGVSPFDANTGKVSKKKAMTYSDVFGEMMLRLVKEDKKVHAIVAAMQAGTGLLELEHYYPERISDVGIAEQHAVTLAAGMAIEGLTPVVAVYSTFLQRAYDQVLHDVGLQNLHVVFAIDRAGLIGEDGETHQGLFDLSFLNPIPNMSVIAPSDYCEFRQMLQYAVKVHNGPIAVRYPRGGGAEELYEHSDFVLGKAEIVASGEDVSIIAVGNMVEVGLKVAEILGAQGIKCEVINCRTVKPLDSKTIIDSAQKTSRVAVLEENSIVGGLSSIVVNAFSDEKVCVELLRFGYPDKIIEHGSKNEIALRYCMDENSIAKKIRDTWGGTIGKGKN